MHLGGSKTTRRTVKGITCSADWRIHFRLGPTGSTEKQEVMMTRVVS